MGPKWGGCSAGATRTSDARAFERALELLDLTLADPRWRTRLKKIARARELLCDTESGGVQYRTSLQDPDRYFLAFAVAARVRR